MSSILFADEAHEALITDINRMILAMKGTKGAYSADKVSDGYHTFGELYDQRARLFAVLCNACPGRFVRSKRHHDDDDPMYDSMFIVGVTTPKGPVSYHLDEHPYWEMFDRARTEYRFPFEREDITPEEEVKRLESLNSTHGMHYINIRNEFTEACDEHLRDIYLDDPGIKSMGLGTALLVDDVTRIKDGVVDVSFRFSGATRGHLKFSPSSGKIAEVQFYRYMAVDPDIGCYKESVLELEEKFKGAYFKGDTALLIRALVEPHTFEYWDSCIRKDQ